MQTHHSARMQIDDFTRIYNHRAIATTMLLYLVLPLCSPAAIAEAQRGDPVLVNLVAFEYQNVDEFMDALGDLETALLERGDRRATFTAIYSVLTKRAMEDLEEGQFEDSEWAAALTVAFGNLYREAFYNYETGNLAELPWAWRVAFDVAAVEGATVFQHALLGVSAHVNHDLPYAIATVTPSSERGLRYSDYVVTNELVVGAILEVERLLGEIAPPLAELDNALGDLDAALLCIVLTRWRFRAWSNAQLFDGRLPLFYESFMSWWHDIQTGHMARVIAIGTD